MEVNPRRKWILDNCVEPVLDVGSQSGWIFKGVGLRVVYLDLDVYPLRFFVQGDGHRLPFRDKCFRTVVLAELLEHVGNPILVLKEAKRVCSDRIVITVPAEHFWHPSARPFTPVEVKLKEEKKDLKSYFEKETTGALARCYRNMDRIYHRRYYTGQMLKEQLETVGGLDFTVDFLSFGGFAFWVAVANVVGT